mmetsp:Transcript_25211/g.84149  ORF Transcript_25211/g.84149 Transcript_25211/m.84149 type:complete len:231 (+) Transcript_25211:327-1019(+)
MHLSPLQARARHRPTTGQHPRARPQAARSAQMKTLATRPQPRQGRRSRPLPRSPRACGCNICRRRRCRHEPVAEEGRACSSSSCSAAEAQVAAPSARQTWPGNGLAKSLDEARRCRGGASLWTAWMQPKCAAAPAAAAAAADAAPATPPPKLASHTLAVTATELPGIGTPCTVRTPLLEEDGPAPATTKLGNRRRRPCGSTDMPTSPQASVRRTSAHDNKTSSPSSYTTR